jgi:5-methylcytosine-specific restriction endonuclease McrA
VNKLIGLTDEERVARRKEQMARADRKHKAANREKLNAAERKRRAANLEKNAARMREYRARKPDVIARCEARRVRPDGHRERFNAYRREWAKLNPDKISEYAHRRSGRRIGRLPAGTIKAIGESQSWMCVACSVSLLESGYHKDHIMPLAMGGLHEPENIQLLCPRCNMRKGAKHPDDFMRSIGAK